MKRLHLSGAVPPAAATPSGCFVMRAPLLPYDVLAAFGDALEASGTTDPSRRADALARDRARLRIRLRETVARPEVREAIFLASPGLEASLWAWERDPEGRRGQQIERALFCYVARMAGRPTPFGLFATVSVGAIGDRTRLMLDEPASCRRHTRLGIDYLVALADAIDHRREVRERVHFRVNPTLYRAAGRVRYTAVQRTATSRAYRLVAADITPSLEATVARAAGGRASPTSRGRWSTTTPRSRSRTLKATCTSSSTPSYSCRRSARGSPGASRRATSSTGLASTRS